MYIFDNDNVTSANFHKLDSIKISFASPVSENKYEFLMIFTPSTFVSLIDAPTLHTWRHIQTICINNFGFG